MTLREAEANSIRAFLMSAGQAGLFSGRVLDFGCGKMPYRDIVEAAGGDYYGYDSIAYPANVSGEDVGSIDHFGHHRYAAAVLCTQVVQYVPDPCDLLMFLRWCLGGDRWQQEKRGHLVLTYPTNWPEVESEDLHRFTKAGMERFLTDAGLTIVEHVPRHATKLPGGEMLVHGYGCIAQA